jgi:hypothetical protein
MKLQDKERKHAPFDVAAGLAEALLAQGYVKIEPEIKRPTPNAQWAARPGVREGDYQGPPKLFYSCSACGNLHTTESQKGTAHISAEFRHCGVVDRCPEDVAAKYQELFNEWKSRSRKSNTKKPAVSAWTNNPRNLQITGVQVIARKPGHIY